MFEAEGFELTEQALFMLAKLKNVELIAKDIIQQAKKRKFVIAGGDIYKYISTGKLPESPCLREDL